MTLRPVVPRQRAWQDIDEAIVFYQAEGGSELAQRFIDAVQQGFQRISRNPGVGSQRYAYELGIEGLRAWQLRRFPWLAFYHERPDHIDVLRVLHAQRDIAAWMTGPEIR